VDNLRNYGAAVASTSRLALPETGKIKQTDLSVSKLCPVFHIMHMATYYHYVFGSQNVSSGPEPVRDLFEILWTTEKYLLLFNSESLILPLCI
jgi:hypothetical protein